METNILSDLAVKAHSLDAISASLDRRLKRIDWSFSQRSKAAAIEGIHPYPAKFIGDIPRAFIDALPIPPGTAVLDPFCGSGTTLMEAQRAGLPSVGIDLNPIACLIARVKTAPLPEGFADIVQQIISKARNIHSLPPPDIPNINHWFKPEIQLAVGALAQTMAEPAYASWLDQLRAALSSILVRVSNQDSDTRYAAIEKKVARGDVFDMFATAAARLERALLERLWGLPTASVLEANTLEVQPSEIGMGVGLVVTSPPYPNAYEYWLYHKYRMWWLGFDPISVKEKEIGARAHFFKKNPHTADLFVHQMKGAFELIDNVLVKGGFVCFVVGRSKIHGQIINNGNIIHQVATEIGLEPVSRFERVISATRKSFNLSHANIKTETIIVLQKN
ncbi:DNA methyltransferase [Nitrosovibrio sp. Nv6]|uniref:DNA methyltransferase n=1 Tax=Nitrosovibrio sp. Nv6 TaxID=1855340 RepID=UPI0008BF4A9E|nr:DNA methyltransferase [Nitrosovibrio sp. Nv6]SEP42545.1 site-specific DNA-methyltransferase (cytosine-N4-specific) [Nitrosovibrio sp. Nv6]